MAIAFDAASGNNNAGSTTSLTVSHTCTGSDRALVVAITGDATNADGGITGVTYNGTAMTKVATESGSARDLTLWYLNAPTSGTHDIIASRTGTEYIMLAAASYTGVSQTGQPEAQTTNVVATQTSLTTSLTTSTNNAWTVLGGRHTSGTITAGTGSTKRSGDGVGGDITGMFDSNGPITPAGLYSMTFSGASNANDPGAVMIALAPVGTTDAITITTPVQYHTLQRNGSNQASIPITGTYTGTPTAIEASFNGGSYSTIVASPSAGTYSGTLSAQAQGQGTLTVRWTNNTSISATKADVGIGERFIVGGDSIAEGRGASAQSYSHATLKGTVFRQDDAWANGNDPIDTGTSSGTHWPWMLTELMDELGVPVALVSCGTGSTDVAGSHNEWAEPNSAYEEMETQAGSVGDSTGFRGVLMHLGPNAIVNASTISQATYNAALDTLASNIQTDITGAPKLLLALCGEVTTGTPPDRRAAMENIRGAILEAVGDNSNIKLGPNLVDDDYSDGVHPSTTAQLTRLGRLWALSVLEAFFSGVSSRGPRVSAAKINTTLDAITLTVDRDLASGTTYGGFRVEDSGTPMTITSATRIDARKISLALSAAASAIGNVGVSFASENDAAGQTVPQSTAVTLPTANTISLTMEPFTDTAVVAALTPLTFPRWRSGRR